MEYAEYERRAKAIDTWANEQYRAGKMTEAAIERAVERMFDALDNEYCPSRHVGFTGAQSYSDFLEGDGDGKYPGWTASNAAARDNW